MRHATLIAACVAFAAAAFAADLQDQLAATTTASQLVAWNDRVAFVMESAGVPDVFVSDTKTTTLQRLTNTKSDSGLAITSLTWSTNGLLLFVAVGQIDGGNPLFLTQPPNSCVVALDSTTPNQSLECPQPTQSETPIDWSLWSAPSTWSASCQADQGSQGETCSLYFGQGGSLASLVFRNRAGAVSLLYANVLITLQSDQGYITDVVSSPLDANMLAFTNVRGDHAFVGVFNTSAAGAYRFLSPSIDTDGSPAWAPDGQAIAFLRTRQLHDNFGRPTIAAFSVMLVTVSPNNNNNARAVELFRDYAVGQPVTYGYGLRPLQFLSGDLVVFPFEGSGYLHVVGVATTAPFAVTDLTPGHDCEAVSYTAVQTSLLVVHNCDLVDSRSISLVSATGNVTRVVGGTANAIFGMANPGSGVVGLQNGGVVYFGTGADISLTVFAQPASMSQIPSILFQSAPIPFSVIPAIVTFPSVDNQFLLHGQLFVKNDSAGKSAQPRPAVIFTHGGPPRQMFGAFHFDETYALLFAQNQYLSAAEDIVLLSINYRMGIGYGKKFRDCVGCGPWGGAEAADILAGFNFLASLPDLVDIRRVGIHGLSYGGLNTLQALARWPANFAVGCANAPVFNWLTQSRFDGSILYNYNPSMPALAIGTGPEADLASPDWPVAVDANMKLSFSSSPASLVANISAPLLVIQGDSDRNVDVQESIGLVRMLQAAGKNQNVQHIMFPNEIHGLSLFSNQVAAAEYEVEFLLRFLQ